MKPRFPSRYSPLHVAAQQGHYEVIQILLKHGVDVNAGYVGWPYGDEGFCLNQPRSKMQYTQAMRR
jgi:ankyrin repeat protein